jgi:regulator of RNase E activity RraA
MQHPQALLDELASFDTPTICNALEVLGDGFCDYGYTKEPLMCAFPDMAPMVGYAVTAMVATSPPKECADALNARRRAYYAAVAAADGPKIVVSQDVDGARGPAASWGEVMAHAHQTLGCLGVLTDGAIRDIAGMPANFQFLATCVKPSHGRLHWVDYGQAVTIAGLLIKPGDLIHMDCNGAARIPHDLAAATPDAARSIQAKEEKILNAAKAGDKAQLLKMFGAENT